MMQCSLLSLGCVFGFSAPEDRSELTALRALKIAQRRLRPEVRAKLLSVSSPMTNGCFVPMAWRFIFFDAATSDHNRMVTVAAKASSEHPETVEAFSTVKNDVVTGQQVIPQNKWTIDSDNALEKVRATSKLKNVKKIQYQLVQARAGQEPFWTLHFFNDREEATARFRVGAKTGTVEPLEVEAVAGA